jgi:hypothetical protein
MNKVLEKIVDFVKNPDVQMGCLFTICGLGATVATAAEAYVAYTSFNELPPDIIRGGMCSIFTLVGSVISGFSYVRAVQSFKGN